MSDYQTTLKSIRLVKDTFTQELNNQLSLITVEAPLFVTSESGLNDNLSGTEKAVMFKPIDLLPECEIVQSLAKWKRLSLKKYGFKLGEGICTDMKAIRKHEILDSLHSILVDQWDWERIICYEERYIEFLKEVVIKIVKAICDTHKHLCSKYPEYSSIELNDKVSFVTTQELEELYPTLTSKDRENAYVKEHPTTFLMQIGDRHDSRSPDYDDWKLNGDLLFWHKPLECAMELSSMGIRVDKDSLLNQLKKTGTEDRLKYPYHQMIMNDELPYTIGGGIGQSRLCMLLFNKKHIGQVQASVWHDESIPELL